MRLTFKGRQTFVDLPEDVLKALRQMNPRDVANMQI